MMMPIRPLDYNVLIRPDAVEEKTKGGLFLPEDQQSREKFRQVRGTVVAVAEMAFSYPDGPALHSKPEPGDRVIYAKGSGTEVSDGDDKLVIVKDRDILAMVA